MGKVDIKKQAKAWIGIATDKRASKSEALVEVLAGIGYALVAIAEAIEGKEAPTVTVKKK